MSTTACSEEPRKVEGRQSLKSKRGCEVERRMTRQLSTFDVVTEEALGSPKRRSGRGPASQTRDDVHGEERKPRKD